MPSTPAPVFLDTSYIRRVGLYHPDFQRLAEYSKLGQIRLFVSHIAWEERRTQYLEVVGSRILKLRSEFDGLLQKQADNFILRGLPSPTMKLWDTTELEARSHEEMNAFAKDNHITIVPLGADHADRAWRRYFQTDLPFDSEMEDREKRRKDIPDSWILEAAIDLKREHSTLTALCDDKRFANALRQALDIPVFTTASEALEHILGMAQDSKDTGSMKVGVAACVPLREGQELPDGELALALTEAESQFRSVATKVIGLVSYLGSPTKDQVYAILEQSGIPTAMSKSVAAQLAFGTTILDTGHHYVPGNKEAGAQAKTAVESEIIRLITGEK